MELQKIVKAIIDDYSQLEEVEVITLAGSRASKRQDSLSDIDIDLFLKAPICVSKREAIAKKYSDQIEIDNQYFGCGDEYILRDLQVEMDICLFEYEEIMSNVKNMMTLHLANTGYTTCFLHNISQAEIVFDRTNEFTTLVQTYRNTYPIELKENIIKKNYPILRDCISSYYHQIEKAIIRDDLNSVIHRVTACLASYYDIIFAINEMPHPGEKRLLNIIEKDCKIYPKDFKNDIEQLIKIIGVDPSQILPLLNKIVDELDVVLDSSNLR